MATCFHSILPFYWKISEFLKGEKKMLGSNSGTKIASSKSVYKFTYTVFVPLIFWFSFTWWWHWFNGKLTARVDVFPSATPKACLVPTCFSICYLLEKSMSQKLHVAKWKPIILFYDKKQIMLNMFHIHQNNFLMFPSFGHGEFLSH